MDKEKWRKPRFRSSPSQHSLRAFTPSSLRYASVEKRRPLVKLKPATSGLELGTLTTSLEWLDPVSGLLLTDAKLLAGMFCFLSSPLSFCSCKEPSCTDTVVDKN